MSTLSKLVSATVLASALAGAAVAATPAPVPDASNDRQLAASAGVEAGVYTAAELQAIIDAKRDNDTVRANFFITGANRANPAQNTSGEGLAQLARAAGVQPGQYTQAELIAIIDARKANDARALNFWLTHANRAAPSEGSANPGKVQLAKILGVNPDDYSLADLVLMQSSISD